MRSSQRATAEGSPPATLAISSVSSWSQSCQPSRSANCLAISPPPLPNSRSTVMMRYTIHLVHGNFSPWPGPLHKEDQGNHTQNSSAEEPKIVDVGQHVGLPKQIALH